nr:integrase, catalytic region, zinc finger, CCHC-type, peptidase aspartic, catalytic [Tanacetum cinerariifolium]
ERVHDFQLGIKSYQMRINISAPTITYLGIKKDLLYSITGVPFVGIVCENNKKEKRAMDTDELQKFSDATLSKDEAPKEIKTFLTKITSVLEASVISVRTDNGTKFKNQVLKEYLDSIGISHQASFVRTPRQNRVVEQKNRTALCYPKNDREDIRKLGAKADTAPTLTNSSFQATDIPITSRDFDELEPQQRHVQQKDHQAPLQPETVDDNVLNTMLNWNTLFLSQDSCSSSSHLLPCISYDLYVMEMIRLTCGIKARLHLLHMDLCGPMRIASINGKRYILVIVDDYSRYTWVHFLRSKDEAPEAIATACFTQNRSIIHRRFNKKPYELINGRKPDISFLYVFGSLCYPKNDHEDIGKLGAKAMYNDYIGGQPLAALRTALAAPAPQVLQTTMTSTIAADTAPTLTNSSSQVTDIPIT